VTTNDALGQPKDTAELADFVLEEGVERLDDTPFFLERHDAVDAVVMGLDGRGDGAARGALDHVGIKGALGKQLDVVTHGVEEDIDEETADDAALFLGIGHSPAGRRGIARRHRSVSISMPTSAN
jgi:hypothetical protein